MQCLHMLIYSGVPTRARWSKRTVPGSPQTVQPYLGLQPPKSGFNTVILVQFQTHCFSRQAHRATLSCIFLSSWSAKSDKQWKFLWDCLEHLAMWGPMGHHTLITLKTSLGQIFQSNPFRLSAVCTRSPNWSSQAQCHSQLSVSTEPNPKVVRYLCC